MSRRDLAGTSPTHHPRSPNHAGQALLVWLAAGAAIGSMALVSTACGAPGRQAGASAAPAKSGLKEGPAAPVSFADLSGIQESLKTRRGRPLFVNFWATWCAPCLEEMPLLAKLARDSAPGGPEFLGISVDAWVTGDGAETEEKVRRALAGAGVAYANLIYRGDQDPLVNAFHLPGPIPYSVLYDREGRVAETWAGPIDVGALERAIHDLR